MSLSKKTTHIFANNVLARMKSGIIGIVPSSTKPGDIIVRNDGWMCCTVLQPMTGYKDANFDEDAAVKMK